MGKLLRSPIKRKYPGIFRKDLGISQESDEEDIKNFKEAYEREYNTILTFVGHSNKSDTDFIFSKPDGSLVKFEKKDDEASRNGYVSIELGKVVDEDLCKDSTYLKHIKKGLEQPEKLSGINVTESDIWVQKIRFDGKILDRGIEVSKLKELVKGCRIERTPSRFGDKYTFTFMYKLSKSMFIENSFKIAEREEQVQYLGGVVPI